MIAKVAVAAANFAIDKPYSYFIPREIILQPGMRVQVPFGRSNRRTEGIVLSVEEGVEKDLKPVERSLDSEPVLSDTMLRLAAFLRERYFCTLYDAVRGMLPGGLWFNPKNYLSLTEDRQWQEKTIRKNGAVEILNFLLKNGNSADEALLRNVVSEDVDFDDTIRYLLSKKWLSSQTDFRRRINDKTEQIATLLAPAEEVLEFAKQRPKSAAMQRSVLELICSVGSAPVKEICYYTGAGKSTVRRLADMGFISLSETPVLRCREIKPITVDSPLILNKQQTEAFQSLVAQMKNEKPGAALLYGVTGSGKTAVYIKLIQHCLEQGKQAILLVPEIALTPQLLGLMSGYFGNKVAVLHSSLPTTERYDQWKRIRAGEAMVVVGTRSAVFAPCPNLGLMILDEEQEHSYKSENTPRYAAKDVALWRGVKEQALVLFGSATPSVETMYYARNGVYSLYTLDERYNGKPLPHVEIVDMREELKQGNASSISYPLQDAIKETLNSGNQTILFLNRRGNSRALVCVDCGEIPECPRCSARLTYHSANERIMCHYCGHSQVAPTRCPKCGGPLKQIGVGTQKVQQELQGLFSGMDVLRMDTDTVSAVNTHEKILNTFSESKTPVLVGTQMVAKGLNLPNVTLVGVLDADLSLYMDNFRAAETTFNMLTQVVGRAGRGEVGGRAIIQTLVPNHQVIQLAAKQDYDSFYELEIGLRRIQKAPPFGDMATITFTGMDEAAVLRGAIKLRDSLRGCLLQKEYMDEQCEVLGPAPCPVPKINYNYRYRLSLKCVMTKKLRALIAYLLRAFSKDRENRNVSAFIDINGFD